MHFIDFIKLSCRFFHFLRSKFANKCFSPVWMLFKNLIASRFVSFCWHAKCTFDVCIAFLFNLFCWLYINAIETVWFWSWYVYYFTKWPTQPINIAVWHKWYSPSIQLTDKVLKDITTTTTTKKCLLNTTSQNAANRRWRSRRKMYFLCFVWNDNLFVIRL